MLFRTILVCLFGFTLVKFAKSETLTVDFQVALFNNTLYCDKHKENIDSHQYSVLDGDHLYITINYAKNINDIRCTSFADERIDFHGSLNMYHNVSVINITEIMNTTWNCRVLTHKDSGGVIKREVVVNGVSYSAVDCVIQIHVLQKLPQEILINNNPLALVRDTTSTAFDFTGVYEYGDDDVFEVICRNTKVPSDGQLGMQYSLTDPSKRVYMSNQSSHSEIGFRGKFTSRDHSSSIKCIYQNNEHARAGVQVKFMYRSNFDNVIRVRVNGLTFRLINPETIQYPYYTFDYTVYSDERVFLECEIERNDLRLQFVNMTEINKGIKLNAGQKRIELQGTFKKECWLRCVAEELINPKHIEETVQIRFIQKSKEKFQLNVDLPPENIVWEVYESRNKKTIYYEFGSDMDLNVSCTATAYVYPVPVVYIQFGDRQANVMKISKQIHLSLENSHTACYLKSQAEVDGFSTDDAVLQEIQIYFVKFDPTTTTSTTTPAFSGNTSAKDHMDTTPAQDTGKVEPWLFAVAGAVTFIVIICVTTVIFRLNKNKRLQGGSNNPEYVNLQGTSEASIPAYPSQWEGNYAVPADLREDSATYCVPYRPEGAVYSVPIPKAERKKKLNKESTHNPYSNVQNAYKNTRSDDPNYAEVLPKKKEECYAKVLPKVQRMARENSPYSYVTGPRPLDITDENRSGQDELYCELNARNH